MLYTERTLTALTDKKTRDKAIKNLSIFLSDSSRDAIPEQEMGKLWKGIFYCMSQHLPITSSMPNFIYVRFLDVGQTARSTGPSLRIGRAAISHHYDLLLVSFLGRILGNNCA